MRKIGILGLVGVLALFLAGCGGGGSDGPPVFTATILSDQPSDGDIAFDSIANSFTVSQGPNTLFFGIDSLGPNQPEYRAFLDFPLDGSTGEDIIPLTATITFAEVRISVVSVEFAGTIPTLVDLVTYTVGGLGAGDFNSPPLTFPGGAPAFRDFDFFSSDAGFDVAIEVTSLMREAQRRGLADFQLRFLLDFVPNPAGFVGIDDRPTVIVTAPKLIVRYF
jgi:hypothetical protein